KRTHSDWIIQVGAYPGEEEAKQKLNAVKIKAGELLRFADPFTESVAKGETTLYRARFAGLDKDQAEAACKYLKKNDVACISLETSGMGELRTSQAAAPPASQPIISDRFPSAWSDMPQPANSPGSDRVALQRVVLYEEDPNNDQGN